MKIYDLSPVLSNETAVFPGDTKFERHVQMSFSSGDHLLLSSIQTTLHLGAHADAPNHYHQRGRGISEVSLTKYLGKAQVIEVKKARGQRITFEDLKDISFKASRILFKTLSFPDPDHWNNDFVSLSDSAIGFLEEKGVELVGIDTPSVDLAEDKVLEAHQAIFKAEMAILEGLVLKEVPEGLYTLIALPLKIKDADASPVRAILIDQDWGLK